jgi:hypothetical protein
MARRVVVIRRKLSSNNLLGIETKDNKGAEQMSLIDGPENTTLYEYSVLLLKKAVAPPN